MHTVGKVVKQLFILGAIVLVFTAYLGVKHVSHKVGETGKAELDKQQGVITEYFKQEKETNKQLLGGN